MENESISEMWSEMKASKFKMAFIILILAAAPIGITTTSLDLLEPAPPISKSYDELMKEIYLSDKTTAQQKAAIDSYQGKRVKWKGTVIDVRPAGSGYQAELSEGDREAFTDFIIQGLSRSQALSLSPGQTVRFVGSIDRIEDGMVTGYVHLKDVQIL